MNIKKIIFSALIVLGFTGFSGVANSACGKLVIAEQNWASAELMANVDKIILENGSVQNIPDFPNDLKEAREFSQTVQARAYLACSEGELPKSRL